jgi:hypothetical protein
MPKDPFIHKRFIRDIIPAREQARGYFERRNNTKTAIETWREIQSYNIEFVMKRLREPEEKART